MPYHAGQEGDGPGHVPHLLSAFRPRGRQEGEFLWACIFSLKVRRLKYEGNSVLTLASQFSREIVFHVDSGACQSLYVCAHIAVLGEMKQGDYLCVSPDV